MERRPNAPDGLYWIDVDGGDVANAEQLWCDMTYDGGGWTRCMGFTTAAPPPANFPEDCRGFGAQHALFKIWNQETDSESGVEPSYVVKMGGNIDDAFNMTERGQSWRIDDSDGGLRPKWAEPMTL